MPIEEFNVVRDHKQEIVKAEKRQPSGGLQRLTVEKGIFNWMAFARTRFETADKTYLTVQAAMSVPSESTNLLARAEDKQLKLAFDFSRYDETHKVFVSGTFNTKPVAGALDPRTGNYDGDRFSIDALLSPGIKQKLEVFSPVFDEMKARYDAERKQHERVINQIIHNSMWGSAGRAACWGFAGLGAAAACAGTFGAGCAIGAFAFAAAASVCNDQY
jgi:hypothetical protein